ncbi:MAG: hypothetical protein KBD16_01190 [Candidatus Pacebacteria bacterium]|nr:hypothetical protein [Candidatus Paceibacterota bacterium]
MTYLTTFVLILIVIAVIGILDAKLGLHMTTIPEASAKFLQQGESFIRPLINHRGHHVESVPMTNTENQVIGEEFAVVEGDDKPLIPGYYWTSGLYPVRKLARFDLNFSVLKEESQRQGHLREWVQTEVIKNTDTLPLRIPIAFLLEEVELEGRFNVDVLVYALLEVVRPRIPVFVYKGDFVKLASAAIQSRFGDVLKTFNIEGFTKEPKGRGSEFSDDMRQHLNTGGGDERKARRLDEEYGVRIVEIFTVEFQLSDSEGKDVQNAIKAQQVALLEGEALNTQATAQRKALATRAEGKATDMALSVKALIDHGVDPDVAATIVGSMRVTENVPNLTTLVTGGSAGVTIPVTPPNKKGAREEKS